MDIPEKFLDMVNADIERLENIDRLYHNDQLKLHQEIDARYQACVQFWYSGLFGANTEQTKIDYWRLEDPKRNNQLKGNLRMMKAKLETFRLGMNVVHVPDAPSTNVTVNTNVNVSITFEQARQTIEDMPGLNNADTEEIITKIDELETISKEPISKKKKWEKIKPILLFALDKGADVAITIMGLIMQMKLGM